MNTTLPFGKITGKYKKYQDRVRPVFASRKSQAYTMLILSFFTMAFFGFFALRPTLRIIAQLQREITDSHSVDDGLSKKIEALAQAQADYELVSGAVPSLYKALPTSPEVAQLLSAIEQIVMLTEATISSLTVEEVVLSTKSAALTSQSPTGMSFSLTASGDYEQIVQLIELLVASPRIIKIDSLSLSSSGEDKVSVDVSTQADGYYYPEQQHFEDDGGETSSTKEPATGEAGNIPSQPLDEEAL